MTCRVCDRNALSFLWVSQGKDWFRCAACGSDTSSSTWEDTIYDGRYIREHAGATPEFIEADMKDNFEWFGDANGRSFLDIGCAEGSALRGMQKRGWEVAGFDIVPDAKEFGPNVTTAERFAADLFPRRFGAILAREVIEHVPDWRGMLTETFLALLPGGLFQVQTPKPLDEPHEVPYQRAHLQLFNPPHFRWVLEEIGFRYVDFKEWNLGQAYMLRR